MDSMSAPTFVFFVSVRSIGRFLLDFIVRAIDHRCCCLIGVGVVGVVVVVGVGVGVGVVAAGGGVGVGVGVGISVGIVDGAVFVGDAVAVVADVVTVDASVRCRLVQCHLAHAPPLSLNCHPVHLMLGRTGDPSGCSEQLLRSSTTLHIDHRPSCTRSSTMLRSLPTTLCSLKQLLRIDHQPPRARMINQNHAVLKSYALLSRIHPSYKWLDPTFFFLYALPSCFFSFSYSFESHPAP